VTSRIGGGTMRGVTARGNRLTARGGDEATTALTTALTAAGERVTLPRRAIARLVAARDGHFTAAQLIDDAAAAGEPIGRATVYRALDLFATLGLVERVDLPDGNHAFVACEAVHHHHAICTRCGRSTDIDDGALAETLAGLGRHAGFVVLDHRLEVFGLCAACGASRA
jgi:Fur family ferric uptake transcriptional regulator